MEWKDNAIVEDCLLSLLSSGQVISEDFQEEVIFRVAAEFLDVSTTDLKAKWKTWESSAWDEECVRLQRCGSSAARARLRWNCGGAENSGDFETAGHSFWLEVEAGAGE